MIYSRAEVATAVHYWGQHGAGKAPLTLTREAGKVVAVLATMDFNRESSVQVPDESEAGKLLLEAQRAVSQGASQAISQSVEAAQSDHPGGDRPR